MTVSRHSERCAIETRNEHFIMLCRKAAVVALASLPAWWPMAGTAQSVRVFDDNNNEFVQQPLGNSVRGVTFEFRGGNDRLVLLRSDDLAGLGGGPATIGRADMGDGRDVVITRFNMSGEFLLGPGNDVFVCEGNESTTFSDLAVSGGPGRDIMAVTTSLAQYAGDAGNDIFVSDGSNNAFDGGDDRDTYSLELAESAASVNLPAGQAFARFNQQFDSLVRIENVRGSRFNDEILGDANDNRIDGLGGDDVIESGGGNDTVDGGAGTNSMDGGPGTDTLVVNGTITSRTLVAGILTVTGSRDGAAFTHNTANFEQVLENGELRSVAFFAGQSAVNNVVSTTVIPETSVLAAVEAMIAGRTLNGNARANALTGEATGDDDISGFGGPDTLRGLGGDDVILGGPGRDRIEGGDGNDIVSGDGGNDNVSGGSGDDEVSGGPGLDRLEGGPDRDTFLFLTPFARSADTVVDYNVLQDSIVMSSTLVGLTAGPLPAANFANSTTGAIDADDRIIYNGTTGRLFFDRNGSAPGGQVLVAILPAGLVMTAAEITLR